jgi:hypothetical protein
MALIFMYRRASLRDVRKIYPAKSKPAVPTRFRTTLNKFILLPSARLPLNFDAVVLSEVSRAMTLDERFAMAAR